MAEITTGPAVPFALPVASGEVTGTTDGGYLGLCVVATGEAATVTLYDNAEEAAGAVLEQVALASGASISLNYPRPGRRVLKGIYAVITGKPKGSIFQ